MSLGGIYPALRSGWTVSAASYRWRASSDVWDRVLAAFTGGCARRVGLGFGFVDATGVRAHQHAAGARRTGAIGGVRRRTKLWAAPRAGSRPSCTCERKEAASRSLPCSPEANATSRSPWRDCWMAGPSAVRDEVVHACGRGGWRATRAIPVRPPGAGYASGRSRL